MYYKGANMLHTLRQLIEDDEKWRQILRKMNMVFYHQTVTTKQIEDFLSTVTLAELMKEGGTLTTPSPVKFTDHLKLEVSAG